MRNTRQLELLIQQSNRAKKLMLFWLTISVVGTFASVVIWMDKSTNYLLFGFTNAVMVCGFLFAVVEALTFARNNEMQWRFFENDEPHDDGLSESILDFQEQRPATARLQTQTSENQLLRSRYEFEPSDWRLLINALRPNYPRWTRRALDKTRLFPGITAPGEFGKVCEEFERLGVIRGKSYQWRVTREGWKMLHEAANFRVVT